MPLRRMPARRGAATLLVLVSGASVLACGPQPSPGSAPPRVATGDVPTVVAPTTDTVLATVTTTDTFPNPTIPDPNPTIPERTDRCRWADTAARVGYGGDTADLERGIALECALREHGERVRVVVRGSGGIPLALDVYTSSGAKRPSHSLRLDNDERAGRGSDLVLGEDLNDDGWTDLEAQTFSGTGGIVYDVFTWNPRTRHFDQDSVMPTADNVRPVDGRACVHSSRRSGVGTSYGAEYCWARGGWHLMRRWEWVSSAVPEGRPIHAVRITEEMRDGKVRSVRVDTLYTARGAIPPDPPGRR